MVVPLGLVDRLAVCVWEAVPVVVSLGLVDRLVVCDRVGDTLGVGNWVDVTENDAVCVGVSEREDACVLDVVGAEEGVEESERVAYCVPDVDNV